jgi:hypothetical protein
MKKSENLSWHIVEKEIHKEIEWLKKSIDIMGKAENSPIPSEYYLYRLIAILIISGQIKAREITSNDLWGKLKYKKIEKVHKHGKDWHRKMMNIIDKYFKDQNYDIVTEPNLHNGRADLGIFKKDKKDLYIEVGTTSIYKLCLNLHFMKDIIILIVPSNNKVIEFEK